MNLQEAKTIFERYFQIVDGVEKVSITGGEPLLNPEIDSILKLLYGYADKILKEIKKQGEHILFWFLIKPLHL